MTAITAISQLLAIASSAPPNDASALETSISALRSSISALDSCVKTLEESSAPWEYLAIVSSFVVFFGIIGEVIVIVDEDRDAMHDWKRGIVLVPGHPKRWRFWFDIAATVIVLAGVLGEAWGSMKLASINSLLRTKTSQLRADGDHLLALVTLEAGSAKSSADAASKDAGTAKLDSDAAILKANGANDLANSASITAGDAIASAGIATAGVDAAELKRKKLETDLSELAICNAPRVITNWSSGDRSSLANLLPLAGQRVSIEYIPFDAEARRAALNLAETLKAANWNLVTPLSVVEGLRDGVLVEPFPHHTDNDTVQLLWEAERGTKVLLDFLHSYDWTAREFPAVERPNSMPAGGIRVQIGLYPAAVNTPLPATKDVMESVRQAEDAFGEEQRRRTAEHDKGLSPEAREREMQFDEATAAKIKALKSPCRVVNPFP